MFIFRFPADTLVFCLFQSCRNRFKFYKYKNNQYYRIPLLIMNGNSHFSNFFAVSCDREKIRMEFHWKGSKPNETIPLFGSEERPLLPLPPRIQPLHWLYVFFWDTNHKKSSQKFSDFVDSIWCRCQFSFWDANAGWRFDIEQASRTFGILSDDRKTFDELVWCSLFFFLFLASAFFFFWCWGSLIYFWKRKKTHQIFDLTAADLF